ncbi:hypothetical protein ACFXAS_06570 [Streptomyces sp. NPDC059459]|uniref:hypothetical protein n=1 Tax=Streptomyces sp. NPDC059459 TaxID=3346839 RepID=UPI0036C3FD1A
MRDPDIDPVTYEVFLRGTRATGGQGLVKAEWRSTGNGAPGGLKRHAYYAVQQAYAGRAEHHAPVAGGR